MAAKTAFGLSNYRFYEFSYLRPEEEDFQIGISFNPSGSYNAKDGSFKLRLGFNCFVDGETTKKDFVKGLLEAEFVFPEPLPFLEIPDFFYVNSIAIIFPYVRAFIGTLTLQANSGVVLLPTLNLTNLEKNLRENTVEVK